MRLSKFARAKGLISPITHGVSDKQYSLSVFEFSEVHKGSTAFVISGKKILIDILDYGWNCSLIFLH